MHDPDIDRLKKSYADVPYYSQAYSNSHPDRLATLGRIFNLSPAPVTACRVLELGCAAGGNIIPMAYFLPESEFVGIELADGHAKTAQQTIDDLGLENIRVQQGNILDVDDSWGLFDYIICHGVFSWVPASVQDKILSIASNNLADQGIVYISYNTYPGWHMREMLRHMMLYHSNQFDEPGQRIAQAKAFIDFLAGAVGHNTNDPYACLLKNELESIQSSGDWFIFHDYLEVVNTPIYFHQFIDRAEKKGLQYLADASFSMMFNNEFSDEVNHTLENVSQNIVQKEQYMDFLRNRQFRQTLLCGKTRNLKRTLDADCLKGLLISSNVTPENDAIDMSAGKMQKFRTPDGRFIETENPIIKLGFKILRENWPKAIRFEKLLDGCIEQLSEILGEEFVEDQDWNKELGRGLLHCFVSGAVELKTWQGNFSATVSSTPRVCDLTRYQVRHRQCIVNLRHETVNSDALALHLIPLLDGTKNKEELLDHLAALVENKTFTVSQYDLPLTDPEKIRQSLDQSIDNVLASLAKAALLKG
jgi:methyltransferase-like protein